MAKMPKLRKRAQRQLNPSSLKEGRYAILGEMSISPSEAPITPEALHAKLQHVANDLRKACPANAPVSLIVEWPSEIRFRAVITALPQGALVAENISSDISSARLETIDKSALTEAEEIAAVARQVSKTAIDIGNTMASTAESSIVPLNMVTQTMAGSPDEGVSRATYGRARGPKAEIHYPDGERMVGGARVIPSTAHSDETFTLSQCTLREVKPSVLAITSLAPQKAWHLLQGHTAGIDEVRGEAVSDLLMSLKVAANAGIPVDLTVCVSEKIATGERWCTPIAIENRQVVFAQGHEWLVHLEESLGP